METAQIHFYSDLAEGMTREFDYTITPVVYENFLKTFADFSPIHVDAEAARARGLNDCVMHGAILNGFVSHFVGMIFPGANSLLLSTELRYLQPNYLHDTLRLTAKVSQKLDVQQVVVLHVTFFNQTRNVTSANGRVQVKLSA